MTYSPLAENVAWQLQMLRDDIGTEVEFHETTYRVVTEEVTAAKVGLRQLPERVLGPFAASADPRVFHFSPQDFTPWTNVVPPQEGDEVDWHGLCYLVTFVTYADRLGETQAVLVYAYRRVM